MGKVITIGAEQEYCSAPSVNLHRLVEDSLSKLDLQLEFYRNMVEFNEMLFSTTSSSQKIEETLRAMAEMIIDKAIEINNDIMDRRGRGVKLYLSPLPFVAYEGLVYNGLHLHINKDAINISSLRSLRLITAFFKQKEIGDDSRFYFSHHIWGAYRPSSYSFKCKARFSPCVLTAHGTIEFRVFSFDDIYEEKKRRRLAYFFHLITSVRSEDEIFTIYKWDGEVEDFWERMIRTRAELPNAYWSKSFASGEQVEVDSYYDEDREEDIDFLKYYGKLYCLIGDSLRRRTYEIETEIKD